MKQLVVHLTDGSTLENEIKTWELRNDCLVFVTKDDETIGLPLRTIVKFVIVDKERDISID